LYIVLLSGVYAVENREQVKRRAPNSYYSS